MDWSTKCERCGQQFTVAGVTLNPGEYHVVLCTECRNDWHVFFNARPEAAEVRAYSARGAAMQSRALKDAEGPIAEAEIAALNEVAYELHERCFGMAHEWMSTKITRDAAS